MNSINVIPTVALSRFRDVIRAFALAEAEAAFRSKFATSAYTDGYTLKWDDSVDKFVGAASTTSGEAARRLLTPSDNGATLGTDKTFYFADSQDVGLTVNLPSPADMTGREITLVNTGNNSEYSFTIEGTINGGSSSYSVFTNCAVKMASSGDSWWVTSEAS